MTEKVTVMEYNTNIKIGFGELKPIIDWCDRNCKKWGYAITESAGRDAGIYQFFFETETDYINFILWKK
jgi:hypothetical protein